MRKIEGTRRHPGERVTRLGLPLGIAVAVALAGGSVAAQAAEPDAYLQDYTAADGQIHPDDGNRAGYSGELCGFQWSAQSVIDTDLPNYSVNGFLESIDSLDDPGLPGAGWADIQHWFTPGTGQLNWRIPVALAEPLANARVEMVFDDPDWTPDTASFQQFSTWTSQPGYDSAFHRFTGIAGYTPHDDTQVTPFEWGTDGAGHTTLVFDLGNMQSGTSTVLQFSGTPVDGLEGVLSGTSYGAKFTLNGLQPIATCLTPSYPEQSVLTGDTVIADATVIETMGAAETSFPLGTIFALDAGSPADATIDAVTGEITWPVPGSHPVGTVEIPIIVTYPDHAEFVEGSTDSVTAVVHVGKQPRLGPFDDQAIVLGDAIDAVTASLRDHLDGPYGDESTLQVAGLPDGVTFDPSSGEIAGIPQAIGVYPVTITGLAGDGSELISTSFTITVTATPVHEQPPAEPPSDEPPRELAHTGGSAIVQLSALGFGLLAVAGLLLRRVRTSSSH